MTTPLMKQYYRIKEQYPDEIVLFHLGDFYEVFDEDARIVSRELDITLTSRFEGKDEVDMAGVPIQKANSYIQTLLDKGYRVAICDQVEDADEANGLVERDVVRVITPGTITEEEFLSDKQNNFLACIYLDGDDAGLSWTDLSTGIFRYQDLDADKLLDELARVNPVECLVPDSFLDRGDDFLEKVEEVTGAMVTTVPDWTFDRETAVETLNRHFETSLLDGFGIREPAEGVQASGALLEYLLETQNHQVEQIQRLTSFDRTRTMVLDQITRRSLELVRTMRTREEEGSLVSIMDETTTSMGGRKLRRWLLAPLTDIDRILRRQEAVEDLLSAFELRQDLQEHLRNVYDIERITSKLGSGRANPLDMVSLRESLKKLPPLRELLSSKEDYLGSIRDDMHTLPDLREELEKAIQEDPSRNITEGGIIRNGYNEELDRLRNVTESGKQWMADFEEQEKEKTDIETLKVGFNQVHGYYIEVSKAKTDQVPDRYNRKQTLKNSERYITEELKEKESQLLNAEEQIENLEYDLFLELRTEVAGFIEELQETADALARLDVLVCLAEVAESRDWRKPDLIEEPELDIKEGRHPVVQELQEDRFIPNHTEMSVSDQRLLIITGPNMAGKSTYIRQVGLICILAQMGSYIPARRATVGIVDRVFTRVGASDELARGASTFMVEMTETANILNNATRRSLVILDEVGRGTSTSDGISIARAVCEHLHDRIGARTLFATHYQELSELEEELPGVKNFHFSVQDVDGDIVFQRKLKPGASDRSYGIRVAEMAGVPEPVVQRASAVLQMLEENRPGISERRENIKKSARMAQNRMFATPEDEKKVQRAEKILDVLEDMDPEETTPINALQELKHLKEIAESTPDQ